MHLCFYANPTMGGELAKSHPFMSQTDVIRNSYAGLSKCGFDVTGMPVKNFQEKQVKKFDGCVLLGLVQRGHIYDAYKEAGKHTIILSGELLRPTNVSNFEGQNITSVSIDAFKDRVVPVECNSRRRSMFGWIPKKEIKVYECGYVLIASQRPGDAVHRIENMNEWVKQQALIIRKQVDNKIIWRPHPNHCEPDLSILSDGIVDVYHDPGIVSEISSLLGASLVVTHNSTFGIECLLKRILVQCASDAMYADLCQDNKDEEKSYSDLLRFLNQVGYSQWTARELWEGFPFKFLLERGLI